MAKKEFDFSARDRALEMLYKKIKSFSKKHDIALSRMVKIAGLDALTTQKINSKAAITLHQYCRILWVMGYRITIEQYTDPPILVDKDIKTRLIKFKIYQSNKKNESRKSTYRREFGKPDRIKVIKGPKGSVIASRTSVAQATEFNDADFLSSDRLSDGLPGGVLPGEH